MKRLALGILVGLAAATLLLPDDWFPPIHAQTSVAG